MGLEGQAPAERDGRRRSVLAAAVVIAAVTLLPGVARANQMTVFSCHDPAGNAVGHAGWVIERTGQSYMTAADTCGANGAGALSLELGANAAGYPNGALIQWGFHAPPWSTIAEYTIDVADSYARPGSSGVGSGQVFVDASDESDPVYDYRNLGGGTWGQSTIERTPPAPVTSVTINASCDGQQGACPGSVEISHADMPATVMLLNDFAVPIVSPLAGSLTSGETLRGPAEASFQAQENGPGIYSAWLTVDGKAQPAVLLNSNNGLCVNLGQTSDGTRAFSSPTPCAQSTTGSVSLDTSVLKDGKHTLKLTVDDAAGNETTAFDGTIATNNAPEATAAPVIVPGPVQVGTTLTSEPGEWAAPEGAGSISYAYQWQACNSSGESCKPIAGAEGSTYTPTPANVGETLRVAVTAADADGKATAASAPSAAVQAPSGSLGALPGPGTSSSPLSSPTAVLSAGGGKPAGAGGGAVSTPQASALIRLGVRRRVTRSFAHRALRLRGRLLDLHHHPVAGAQLLVLQRVGHGRFKPIGHAKTGGKGAFGARVRPGSSRLIEIAYRGAARHGFAALARVHERVRAGVRLLIRPRVTSSTGTIVLRGRVLGKLPHQGVIVDLLVHYRGKWVPFRTPRTRPSGRFRVAYRFQGARGRFPFRAVVPSSQVRFPFARGESEVIHVLTH